MNLSESGGGQLDSIEYAGNMLDRHELFDVSAPNLLEASIYII